MDFSLIIPAFVAGILTFLAPCTLPLVPGYLAFIGGASIEDIGNPQKTKHLRWLIFKNGLLYVVGFSAVFVIFGTLAGFAGAALAPYRFLFMRLGGIFVALFGFFMIGILRLPILNKEFRLKASSAMEKHNSKNSFLLGAAFAFGWTPCVGPILGSVLFLASASATALQGAALLFIFSLGLAIPFLAMALGIGSASKYAVKFSKFLRVISFVGGLFLVGLGILLFLDKMHLLIPWGYGLFDFVNYESLTDYL